mmetsp:Transcript_1628/g.4867  ORF Transcript_1628/g.4867 Transcript_1628/m.4867 type:complete len:852 (-) Transcript_1628:253-2808(-)
MSGMSSRPPVKGNHSITVDRSERRGKSPVEGSLAQQAALQAASDKRRSPIHNKRSPANSRTPSPNLEKRVGLDVKNMEKRAAPESKAEKRLAPAASARRTTADIYSAIKSQNPNPIKSPRSAFQAPDSKKIAARPNRRGSPVGAPARPLTLREKKSTSPYSQASQRKSPSQRPIRETKQQELDENTEDDVELQSITASLDSGRDEYEDVPRRDKRRSDDKRQHLIAHIGGAAQAAGLRTSSLTSQTSLGSRPRPRSAPGGPQPGPQPKAPMAMHRPAWSPDSQRGKAFVPEPFSQQRNTLESIYLPQAPPSPNKAPREHGHAHARQVVADDLDTFDCALPDACARRPPMTAECDAGLRASLRRVLDSPQTDEPSLRDIEELQALLDWKKAAILAQQRPRAGSDATDDMLRIKDVDDLHGGDAAMQAHSQHSSVQTRSSPSPSQTHASLQTHASPSQTHASPLQRSAQQTQSLPQTRYAPDAPPGDLPRGNSPGAEEAQPEQLARAILLLQQLPQQLRLENNSLVSDLTRRMLELGSSAAMAFALAAAPRDEDEHARIAVPPESIGADVDSAMREKDSREPAVRLTKPGFERRDSHCGDEAASVPDLERAARLQRLHASACAPNEKMFSSAYCAWVRYDAQAPAQYNALGETAAHASPENAAPRPVQEAFESLPAAQLQDAAGSPTVSKRASADPSFEAHPFRAMDAPRTLDAPRDARDASSNARDARDARTLDDVDARFADRHADGAVAGDSADAARQSTPSPETVVSGVSDCTAWTVSSPNRVEFSYRAPPSFVPRIRLEALRSPRRDPSEEILSPDPQKSVSTLYSPRSAFTPRSETASLAASDEKLAQ